MATDYQEAIRILSEQEKILQFDSFTSEDAWKLGNIMVEEIRNQGIDLTVSIRKMNGHIIFAYASEGANLNHQNWTDRKFNMVSYMAVSYTHLALVAAAGGMKVAKHGNRAASSKCGTADCLEALGVNIQQSPERCVELLKEAGMCFFFAQKYHCLLYTSRLILSMVCSMQCL